MYQKIALIVLVFLSVAQSGFACEHDGVDDDALAQQTSTTHSHSDSNALQNVKGAFTISSVWARPSTPPNHNSAIYLKIHNDTDMDSQFVTASAIGVAKTVELHDSFVDQKGVSRMIKLDNLTIPAHTTVELKPGKMHIMLFGLQKTLTIGDKFKLKLQFASHEPIEVEVEVKSR
jgi:copper(I)-binding protein